LLTRRSFVASASLLGLTAPIGRAWPALLSPSNSVDADIDAVTGDGRPVTLTRASVQELADSLRGNLLLPGVPAYDEARRVRNLQIDKHPALIVQPRGASDVSSAVQFARASNLLLAVKCGGHSPSGKSTCERGMQIDLSLLRGANVDPEGRIARVAGGSLLGDVDHEAMAHGLVTTCGTVSHTGVGGLTLGGGFGRLARRFGLALDNVRAVEIVTATGAILRANAHENADLFWGVRGGGGNFGVVTAFDFALHPMQRQVVGGTIMFPRNQAKDVLAFYADYEGEAPDDLALDAFVASNLKFTGANGAGFSVCYSGPVSRAEEIMRKIRSAGTAVFDNVRTLDYVALQRSGDETEQRAIGSYTKTGYVQKISPQLLGAMIDGFEEHPERSTLVGFQQLGGMIARVAADATAFPFRNVHATALLLADWPATADPAPHLKSLRQYWTTIAPYTYGFYTNDAVEESQKQVDDNYLGNYSRLRKLKDKYDPTNLFRLNANVRPSA
jgi:FAD/FMN-containing dehydrogenase